MARKAVVIEFGGKLRRLVYDFNAMAELEDLAATYASNGPRLKSVRAALWAGLLADTLDRRGRETKETLSLVQVGDILEGSTAEEASGYADAITEAMGLAKAPDEDPTKASETAQASPLTT